MSRPQVCKTQSKKKNNDIPFIVKRRLFDAGLVSSLLGGCESWVGADIKPISKLHDWAMKKLLGVREATANLVCYAELRYPTLSDLVKYKQHKFFYMWPKRANMVDDPLSFAIKSAIALNNPVGKTVVQMTRDVTPHMSTLMRNVHDTVARSTATRCIVYRSINPHFVVPDVYTKRHTVNDILRMSFTHFRVCGHSRAVATDGWNRRGRCRFPLEEHVCSCGDCRQNSTWRRRAHTHDASEKSII